MQSTGWIFVSAASTAAFILGWFGSCLVEIVPRRILIEYGEKPPEWMKLELRFWTRISFACIVMLLWCSIFLIFGLHATGLALGVGGTILILQGFIDWRTKLLPDTLTYLLLWIGMIAGTQGWLSIPLNESVIGAVCGYVGFAVFAQFARVLSGDGAVGQGDVKLLAAIGAWVGPVMLLPTILFAGIGAVIVGLWANRATQAQSDRTMPFGPFLAGGGLVVSACAPELTSWMLA